MNHRTILLASTRLLLASTRLLLSSGTLLLAGSAAAQGTLFPTSHVYPAGNLPYGSDLADLNGDGKLDYVVANYFGDTATAYLGQGNGQLTPLPAFPTGGGARSCAVADLNGDSKPDLVAALPSDDAVAVLLGDGLGGFGAPVLYTTGAGTFAVWIDAGDMNGDGKVDVVTGNQATNDLSVLLGNGAGGLAAPTHHTIGYSAERIRLADVNADGDLDCVTASWLDEEVIVSLGDGNGNLNVSASSYSFYPKGLEVGDVDADGFPDVITASSQDTNTISIHRSNGSGGLLPPKHIYLQASNLYSTAVMLADVSGDGRADIVSCSASSANRSLTVLVNAGGGKFDFAFRSPIPESAYDALAADLNGDGRADVVTSHQQDDSIRVHIGAGVGSWEYYCSAKVNSLGCTPEMYATGRPSVSNVGTFYVFVRRVLDNKPGLFLYTINGSQAAIPFQGGTLCLGPSGIRRTPSQMSGINPKFPPNNCEGSYARDFNAFAQGLLGGNPDPGLLVLGNSYQLQAWSRDPGYAAPNNSGLSSALEVTPWQ